ncbi:hypothetical protein HNP81_000347 [Peribacillus huizhouensis]|uniref:Uncharacterized protein n=1 Tax=Peribacillus huizhouensis TaxID=1501239 RepID=A0ABR6CKK5_9BACI|nr:hypothetical protein [Peribacillus huizhouensis]
MTYREKKVKVDVASSIVQSNLILIKGSVFIEVRTI